MYDRLKSRIQPPRSHTRAASPKSSHLTILAIALESGFNTKSSFNTFFKKYTGVTPSQYRGQASEAA